MKNQFQHTHNKNEKKATTTTTVIKNNKILSLQCKTNTKFRHQYLKIEHSFITLCFYQEILANNSMLLAKRGHTFKRSVFIVSSAAIITQVACTSELTFCCRFGDSVATLCFRFLLQGTKSDSLETILEAFDSLLLTEMTKGSKSMNAFFITNFLMCLPIPVKMKKELETK